MTGCARAASARIASFARYVPRGYGHGRTTPQTRPEGGRVLISGSGHGPHLDQAEVVAQLLVRRREAPGGNVYTVFDNESGGQSALYPSSRAVTISPDLATGAATPIKAVNSRRA